MDLSVIIPVYNEINTIEGVIDRVKATGFANEIILVDDGSSDGSTEILKKYQGQDGMQVILCEKNRGKGAAVREGIKAAKSTYAIIQDADFEYDPQDYAKLMPVIESGQADVVYGSRFMESTEVFYFRSLAANKLLTFLTNVLYHTKLTDMETCYKLFKVAEVREIPLHSRRFEFEPELTTKLLKRGYKIVEVPISFKGRSYEEGKKIKPKDGLIALWTLLKYRFTD
ncbi:MAG: glycosyltransferase family 2 protein [Anaerolineaceae bacterium]|nr:glycosyltransferase family 2 protein [Anaerolineaceae bacterium]